MVLDAAGGFPSPRGLLPLCSRASTCHPTHPPYTDAPHTTHHTPHTQTHHDNNALSHAFQMPPTHPPAHPAQVVITLNVSAVANGVRVVNMSATCPHAPKGVNTTLSFLLPGAAKSVELRILADRTIVEVFAGSGRGVVSMPVLKPSNVTGAFIFNPSYATSSLTVASAAAWGMGCGWAKYP